MIRIFDVLDGRFARLRPNDRDEIEAEGVLPSAQLKGERSRRPFDPKPFPGADDFQGILPIGAGSRLHLDEHDRIAMKGDEVYLADGAPKVPREDFVAALAKESRSCLFAEPTELRPVTRPTRPPAQALETLSYEPEAHAVSALCRFGYGGSRASLAESCRDALS